MGHFWLIKISNFSFWLLILLDNSEYKIPRSLPFVWGSHYLLLQDHIVYLRVFLGWRWGPLIKLVSLIMTVRYLQPLPITIWLIFTVHINYPFFLLCFIMYCHKWWNADAGLHRCGCSWASYYRTSYLFTYFLMPALLNCMGITFNVILQFFIYIKIWGE